MGTAVALLGHNGSGKSTLLKILAGMLLAHQGSLKVLGYTAGTCQHRVSYLPQRQDIDWSFPMNLEAFALTGAYVHCGWFRTPSVAQRQECLRWLEQLELVHLKDRLIGELSGGQKQRLLLARTLLHGAQLLLLDEPLAAVDASTRLAFCDILRTLKAQGKTVIMATHETENLETLLDQHFCLVAGRLVKVESFEI
jgi:ABC-type Mn2+/Zn2+ transport system ATPase subunit